MINNLNKDFNSCNIDTLGLYFNFKDYDLNTIIELFYEWIGKYKIDLTKVRLAYSIPTYDYLSKYSIYGKEMEIIKWIYQLGTSRINFFLPEDRNKSSEDLFKYITNKNSAVVFIGKFNKDTFAEYERYLTTTVPIICITNE